MMKGCDSYNELLSHHFKLVLLWVLVAMWKKGVMEVLTLPYIFLKLETSSQRLAGKTFKYRITNSWIVQIN
jgi:hypothetical protein